MVKNLLLNSLTIGCKYKPVRGGIDQVLDIYDKYIFNDFLFIANSGKKGILNLFPLISSIWKMLLQTFQNKKIKIIHIHTSSYKSFYRSAIFVLLSKILRKKVILHIHSGAFKTFYETNPRFISWVLNYCDCLIALSDFWKSFFESITNKPLIHVIPNPIVPPNPLVLSKRKDAAILRVLFLGLLTQQKGIYDLLEVLAENKTEFENKLILHVGGNGDLTTFHKKIKQLELENIVIFHGWVSGCKKEALFLNSDLLILPSYAEGLPMVILEAMSYGLPVVATTVGAVPEVVSNENGFLIPPRDKGSLTNILLYLCNNSKEELLHKQKHALKKTKEYSYQSISKQLSLLYKELLQDSI